MSRVVKRADISIEVYREYYSYLQVFCFTNYRLSTLEAHQRFEKDLNKFETVLSFFIQNTLSSMESECEAILKDHLTKETMIEYIKDIDYEVTIQRSW